MPREEGLLPVLRNAEYVADQLGLHVQTVRRLGRERKLPMWKLGGQWVMTDPDLKRLVAESEP